MSTPEIVVILFCIAFVIEMIALIIQCQYPRSLFVAPEPKVEAVASEQSG